MKQLLSILLLSICLYAEATFDQVQSMIDKQQYKQAVLALTIISNNHPASSKVQYTLAQAQAGLGNLPAAKDALDRAIALNPKLDFVSASQVNELSSIINASRVIKPVEPESYWFIWLFGSACISFLFFQFMGKRKKSSKLSTPDVKPSTKYSPSSEQSFYEHTSTAKPTPVNPTNGRSYSEPARTSRPAEAHHHHFASKSDLITTLATAGLTAAAVSYIMDDDKPKQPTHSYQPEPISSSWDDDSNSIWGDATSESTSSSWKDDSSSSSDSWSSSSDSSSSDSSWND